MGEKPTPTLRTPEVKGEQHPRSRLRTRESPPRRCPWGRRCERALSGNLACPTRLGLPLQVPSRDVRGGLGATAGAGPGHGGAGPSAPFCRPKCAWGSDALANWGVVPAGESDAPEKSLWAVNRPRATLPHLGPGPRPRPLMETLTRSCPPRHPGCGPGAPSACPFTALSGQKGVLSPSGCETGATYDSRSMCWAVGTMLSVFRTCSTLQARR